MEIKIFLEIYKKGIRFNWTVVCEIKIIKSKYPARSS